jgi:tetratricopeptide (TPR) repeat protein
MAPSRNGLEIGSVRRRVAALDRTREAALRRRADRDDSGGTAVLWYRTPVGIDSAAIGIQPGVADDLPSLLSALAPEFGWPGAPATARGAEVVAAWARVWQVRAQADLRLLLWWEPDGTFHAEASLRGLDGHDQPLPEAPEIAALLDTLAAAPQSSASPHGLLLAGNRALNAGDYPAARDCYARAAADLPRHPEAHRNLALALAHLGEWDAAAEAMGTALALAPGDPALGQEYLALETDAGVQAAQRGALEEAGAHFLRVLAHWPDEPTALANLGNIRLRERRSAEARAIFRRFLRHHPDHPAAAQIRTALAELGE